MGALARVGRSALVTAKLVGGAGAGGIVRAGVRPGDGVGVSPGMSVAKLGGGVMGVAVALPVGVSSGCAEPVGLTWAVTPPRSASAFWALMLKLVPTRATTTIADTPAITVRLGRGSGM